MLKTLTFSIDSDVYEKFCIAVNLMNETKDSVLENCMRKYVTDVFSEMSQKYNPKFVATQTNQYCNTNGNFYGKANQRIPNWALKPNQINHKIIRAYFIAEDISGDGEVTLYQMEQLCSDPNHPELYVSTFKNNYAQMKLDGYHSHGKVFEDNGYNVWIWEEVKATLLQYKNYFYKSEE